MVNLGTITKGLQIVPYRFYNLRANFSNVEIEIFFAKYDTDGQGINADEVAEVFEDLEDGDFEEKMAEGEEDWLEGATNVGEAQGGAVELHQILE